MTKYRQITVKGRERKDGTRGPSKKRWQKRKRNKNGEMMWVFCKAPRSSRGSSKSKPKSKKTNKSKKSNKSRGGNTAKKKSKGSRTELPSLSKSVTVAGGLIAVTGLGTAATGRLLGEMQELADAAGLGIAISGATVVLFVNGMAMTSPKSWLGKKWRSLCRRWGFKP